MLLIFLLGQIRLVFKLLLLPVVLWDKLHALKVFKVLFLEMRRRLLFHISWFGIHAAEDPFISKKQFAFFHERFELLVVFVRVQVEAERHGGLELHEVQFLGCLLVALQMTPFNFFNVRPNPLIRYVRIQED